MVAGVAAFCVVDGRTGRALYEADFGSTQRVSVAERAGSSFSLCLSLSLVRSRAVSLYSLILSLSLSLSLSLLKQDDARHLRQFVIASAIDRLNERKWELTSAYLKIIDQFDSDLFVYAYCTQGNFQFVLLTTKREEGNVKAFFESMHEVVVKMRMNPFFYDGGGGDDDVDDDNAGGEEDWLATNASFDAKVRRCSRVLG